MGTQAMPKPTLHIRALSSLVFAKYHQLPKRLQSQELPPPPPLVKTPTSAIPPPPPPPPRSTLPASQQPPETISGTVRIFGALNLSYFSPFRCGRRPPLLHPVNPSRTRSPHDRLSPLREQQQKQRYHHSIKRNRRAKTTPNTMAMMRVWRGVAGVHLLEGEGWQEW
jgi:hypothetical protein